MTDSAIEEFARSVKIGSCRLQNVPRFIFLCGGKADPKNSPFVPYTSARDHFLRYVKRQKALLQSRLRLAEEINEWFEEDQFDDLLEVEIFLADLCDVTLLFVESPGSIAELGAFSSSEDLRPKTLAVVNTHFDERRTFIADGPLRRLRHHNKELVKYFRWDPADLNSEQAKEDFEAISRDLAEYLESRPSVKERKFNLKSNGHRMLLIVDLIQIAGILTLSDIQSCFRIWGDKVDRVLLQKYLALLQHLKFIELLRYSSSTFYVSPEERSDAFLLFDFVSPGIGDRERIKQRMRERLEELDPRRATLLRRHLDHLKTRRRDD